MGSTKAKRHTHKYHRVNTIGMKVWACALPDCNHFMPPHYEAMVQGKASLCWKCGEKFILDPTNMQSDRPICMDCAMPGLADIASGIVRIPTMNDNTAEQVIDEPIRKKDEIIMCKCGRGRTLTNQPVCFRCFEGH